MKWAAVIFAYAFCTSCVMSAEDEFVAAGGLRHLQSREQLFERDIRLSLASSGPAALTFDTLSPQAQSCLVNKAIAQASPLLLEAADGFLARQSEASWGVYRAASTDPETAIQPARLVALSARCEAPTFRVAAR